jgi:hypothetical protein
MNKVARLRGYRSDPDAVLEGALLAALERMQLREDRTLLDVLFVTRDVTSGELEAVDSARPLGRERGPTTTLRISSRRGDDPPAGSGEDLRRGLDAGRSAPRWREGND